ncbi:TPA: hypothetical protein ACG85G_002993, partial [Enterococcus faecium]
FGFLATRASFNATESTTMDMLSSSLIPPDTILLIKIVTFFPKEGMSVMYNAHFPIFPVI